MTGAELLVLALRERNVEFVATLSGNGLNPLYLACRDAGIRLIDTRNEQAAAYLADAYARLTRRVGVVAVSSGVAHVNALTGIANAWFDGAPVLLITGESPSSQDDLGKFQELDHVALARPLCKYARRVLQPEKVAFYVREALAHATSGRPGPACLSIPVDVLAAQVAKGKAVRVQPGPGEVVQDAAADPDLVAEAAKLIARAKRPVLVAGTGAFYADAAEELDAFARLAAIPVVVPIWDRGCVERPADYFLGVWARPAATHASCPTPISCSSWAVAPITASASHSRRRSLKRRSSSALTWTPRNSAAESSPTSSSLATPAPCSANSPPPPAAWRPGRTGHGWPPPGDATLLSDAAGSSPLPHRPRR